MSTTLVIFGATGDLARTKLMPALFTLKCKGRLPDDVKVVGFARREFTQATYCRSMWDSMGEYADLLCEEDAWQEFVNRIWFVQGDLTNEADLRRLDDTISQEIEAGQAQANRLYYLSIAPGLYEAAVNHLASSGMTASPAGFRRVVIEKPFGHDGISAASLGRIVHRSFAEDDVLRIDHYLGKETVQNLLVFRFANAIFEPIWNRNYIDQVQITVAEEVDIGNRAGYYDSSGALRDMVQNHLLQLLAMVAMEPPTSMAATALRNEKVKVLQAVRRWGSDEEAAANAVAGQYEGYLSERGVATDSMTPSYAALRLYLDNWRWQGVPFYLRSGKAMAAKTTEVSVQFRRPPHALFDLPGATDELQANLLGLCLQPGEGVHLRFQVKVPDAGTVTQPQDMEFHYGSAFSEQSIPLAYERLLEDAIAGDASLFIRSDQIAESWDIVDPLLGAWSAPGATAPHTYARGSWGPAQADALLAETGHSWLHTCTGRS
jgi:glucose-6-phosphate 1-dehydrogenase